MPSLRRTFLTARRAEADPRERVSEQLIYASTHTGQEAIIHFQSTLAGLSESESEIRLKEVGLNEIAHDKPPHWILQIWHALANPFIAVLVILMVVSFITDVVLADPKEGPDYKTIIVLSFMISVSTLLRFITEFRSTKAAEALKALVRTTATVIRDGERHETPMRRVVPGDIVAIAAGDMIPADVRILTSKDLFISQSILTGESIPVEKRESAVGPAQKAAQADLPILERENVAFMGTNVVSGTATALVAATGDATYFGSMAKTLVGKQAETSFDRGVRSVSYLLIKFMLVMVPVVFVINGITKQNWMEAFLFGIAVAVGLTPEMLPMIVAANLAKGAVLMAKKKCVVKRINAIQNFGAMDILCTDKTGTLTRDKIVLERYLDVHGKLNRDVLDFAYMNSYHQTGLKNLLDVAVLEHVNDLQEHGFKSRDYVKIDEIPFDFDRRRMSVVLRKNESTDLLICKGAVEEILSLCTMVEEDSTVDNDLVITLTDSRRQEALELVNAMNEEGLRVVAVAYRAFPARAIAYSVEDECHMSLVGFIGFLDPPKDDAHLAIAALKEHGVTVKVLTGDSDVIARNVCKQVGMDVGRIVLGREIDDLSEAELGELAEFTSVFAKLSPLQKGRVITSLQKRDHTVGYMGDGINDAAALRDADVGISVDSAADIARESSDIIMLEKDLMVLEEGVIEGRNTFGNIIKYIKMTASSNFGNVFSVTIASIFLPFLPMLAIQLLVQNTLYDLSQTTIPLDRVDPEYLKLPRKWRSDDIGRFMIFIGPISSVFDVTTFLLMWWVFKANSPAHQSLFQSAWFVEGLLSQTLIVHMIRTQKIPLIQSRATWPVILTTASIMAVGIAIPFTRFGETIGLQPLPWSFFPWLVVTLVGYCFLTQVVKEWYLRRWKIWL